VGGRLSIGNQSRPRPPGAGHWASTLTTERLARARWALALFTEVYRPGPVSRTLAPTASLDELLARPSDDEIADLLALGGSAGGCCCQRWPPVAGPCASGRRSSAVPTLVVRSATAL
jgi:hypothetical protein